MDSFIALFTWKTVLLNPARRITFFILSFYFLIPTSIFAETNDFVFHKDNFAIFGPPLINKNYYLLEYGFISEKKITSWDYHYNAYVTGALFEDWIDQSSKLRAGGLGFKGGVILPTQPWVPLLFSLSVGFAKTVLNPSPLFGRDEANIEKKDMFLLEAGFLYRIDNIFVRLAYQKSNVHYFHRHTIFAIGVNY